ncbi:hypothetical protein LTS08_004566 [Lithohypha guttulata]|nr:hypothetical protein LTS08_004566 [Lithohypha guttulata]
MAEETMDTGSKSDRKLMSDAGFSEGLKKQLEERIAQTAFQAQNQQALSQASMPSSAGKGTRDQAAAKAWTGTETLEDAALRMLDDSHKRLRMPSRKPTLGSGVNLKPRPKQKLSAADRLANARDKTSIYTMQQEGMSEEERERFKKEMKDKFQPGARPMPTTLQGLSSLANERIEDAIARGQFKNIPRGKGVNIERDYNANSPFIQTTEYFMNKMIQRQEIVPPWIEKQQELMKLVNTFRSRLRNDWRRHAARTISSKGGTLDEQIRRAKAFALAEEKYNPRPGTRTETMSAIGSDGVLTSITVEEKIAAGVAPEPAQDPVEITITETAPSQDAQGNPVEGASEKLAEDTIVVSQTPADTQQPAPSEPGTPIDAPQAADRILPMAYPFRDENWERNENSYHKLAVEEINSLARNYNLMAPKMAQKPYHNLQRELNRCYADVAPLLADEILNRSRKGPVTMHKEGSVMERFQGTGHMAKIRDEPEARGYGFKEFWKDLFGKDESKKRQVA